MSRRSYDAARRELEERFGELLERGEQARDLSDFEPYGEDPIGFVREILGDDPWSVQEEIAEAVREHRKTAVVGCNALGKDWMCARIACWWAYAVGGLAILTGPTERQVAEVLMRKEVARAKRAGGLPGELFTGALRVRGEEASILAKTASGVSDLTGFHERRVLAVITEAQGVESFAWEALQACATGPEDRLLAVGNPLEASGRFHEVAGPTSGGAGWHVIQASAHDHPNVREGRPVIPGGPSRQWIEDVAADYGRDSPYFVARVEGRFPESSVDGLFRRSWLDAAVERYEERRAAEGSAVPA